MKRNKLHSKGFKMLHKALFALLMLLSVVSYSQKPIDYTKIKSFNIIVNYPDCTVKTQMLKDAKKMEANENYVYHWYASNKIMTTKGGFDGKLLHGYYHCFYLNNNLKESGQFKYGIKNGEWRYWFEDGKLKEIVNWKKGKKNGKYKLYNQVGDLIAESNFKDDKMNGKFKSYSSGRLVETLKYKDGELVVKKTKVKEEKQPKEKKPKKEKTPKPTKEKKKKDSKKKDANSTNVRVT